MYNDKLKISKYTKIKGDNFPPEAIKRQIIFLVKSKHKNKMAPTQILIFAFLLLKPAFGLPIELDLNSGLTTTENSEIENSEYESMGYEIDYEKEDEVRKDFTQVLDEVEERSESMKGLTTNAIVLISCIAIFAFVFAAFLIFICIKALRSSCNRQE